MEFRFSIHLNEKLFLRDPELSDLGKRIIRHGIDMINRLGFEAFTFKKLAEEIHTTEASIYRYFESKHRLLLYILTWYWSYLEYQVVFSIQNMSNPEAKIKRVIQLLSQELDDSYGTTDFDKKALYNIVISESSKTYLTKDVDNNNTAHLFKPYKDLCARVAALFSEYNPQYLYPHSLASTVIEAAHFQHFFAQHLPRLTNLGSDEKNHSLHDFLSQLVFATLSQKL